MRKLITSVPIAVLLSACSSNGSEAPSTSSSHTPTPYTNHTHSEQPSSSSSNANASTGTVHTDDTAASLNKDDFIRGKVHIDLPQGGKIAGENRRYSFNGAYADIDSLTVDGVNIVLGVGGKAIGGLRGEAFKQAFWPLISYAAAPEHDVFYVGKATSAKDMPTQGTARYTGVATRYDALKGTVRNAGAMVLYANFGNKTVSGHLRMDGLRRNITLERTNIRGNSFAGTAVVGTDSIFVKNREGRYEGKFFGPQAEEVAGKATFSGRTWGGLGEDLSNLNTSFGGTKDQ